ncbi:MAG: ComEC/Rec2 family competence protein [Verrucomicrobia bacterium]|nr:ComEC/Rec2 family competence protein [Verrucomicrobiota bacterium]
MTSRSLGHRAPLLWLVLPLIAGLVAGRIGEPAPAPWLLGGALLAAVVAVVTAWRDGRGWGIAVGVAMFLSGWAAYALHRARLPAWDALPPREVRLALRIDRVFAQKDARRASGLATVVRADDHLRELAGQRLYFSLTLARGETPPVRSAEVSAVGVLVTLPRTPPADSFDGYLAGAGMNFRLTRGRIVAETRTAHAYYRFCVRMAERFRATLSAGIAAKRPELAGLLRAMMLGETHELSDEQHTLFMRSGTMHLFAISGLNIAVIAGALQTVLLLLHVPRWPRFLLGAILLWLFVDITGASPSAVRAFVMATFFQAALVLRQPGNPLAAMVASALAVLLLAPLQVFSASFLMSYGIVLALLVLGLPLSEAWLARWTPWRDVPEATWAWWQHAVAGAWRWLAIALAIGLATTLVSVITGVQFFRLLTPGALFANLVLIPAAMLVTLGGFASVVCGLAGWAWGASLCNHAAALVLFGIERVVRMSVQVKGAFLPAQFAAPWVGGMAFALLLTALLAGYAANWRKERGGWWPPFALVAFVLIFGVKFG